MMMLSQQPKTYKDLNFKKSCFGILGRNAINNKTKNRQKICRKYLLKFKTLLS